MYQTYSETVLLNQNMNLRRCRESGMILFSLLIEKLNSWRSWHPPCGKPLRVYIPILCNAEFTIYGCDQT
ncbi:hypothetical protein [Fischerella thermalis]|uniref:hypothetical protein n=1 Tax=Fischerella thermalis TaxID=372787 RepID=UPI0011AF2CE8|nr:hypothetical protein [Fischerella thermalis]